MSKPRKPLRGLFAKTEQTETKISEPKQNEIRQPKPTKPEPRQVAKKSEPSIAHKPTVTQPEIPPATTHSAPTKPESQQTRIADAISKVQYNFELHKNDRILWEADEYVDFIKRIDAAQTEAFFLKGKLLEEVKRRFFEDNKVGWAQFCENHLLMNYTTTNQYIRVSHEFDVTSHQRPDFGFEHFKALLPLAPSDRTELIESVPTISVKALRNMVQERLAKAIPQKHDNTSATVQARSLLKLLQQVKNEVLKCDPELLHQEQRWQLSAASRNIAEELSQLSNALNPAVFGLSRTPSRKNETIAE